MIRRLRRRMTLLVIAVLILVSAALVFGIYLVNNRNITLQAESSLDTLSESRGVRPSLPADPMASGENSPGSKGSEGQPTPHVPEGEERKEPEDGMPPLPPEGEERKEPEDGTQPPTQDSKKGPRERSLSREEVASLSNFYIITLDAGGKMTSWSSDRSELYSEESIQAFADEVMETGLLRGRIGTQFYQMREEEDGTRMLIVLDARLELMAGRRVLWVTTLVAGIACLILSLGAWILIRKMVHPVEEAFRKQQQFVWDASHELKTPLAVISANADVLEGEIGENEYLGYIRSEVHRTDSLVKNLLALARMDQGTIGQEKAETDLSEAVWEVLLPFESTVFEAGKTLISDGIQEGVRVTGNREMLQQLTVILLSNALKYSDEHGTITVWLEKKTRGAELRVENTGEGIRMEDMDRIFDRFYRADASRNSETGGEGLGLAIARSIVEIHHGKIRAESIPGKKAVFIVSLP